MVTGDKSVRRCKKICVQARYPPENFDKLNPEPAPSGVTRGLSQGGQTLLKGAHRPPFANAIISS